MAEKDQQEDQAQPQQNENHGAGKSAVQEMLRTKLAFLVAHAKETICGSLMFFGLVVSFFHGFGSLMVGCGFGWYFAEDILIVTEIAKNYYPQKGLFKTLMWSGLLFLTFARMPMLSISLLIMFVAAAMTARQK
ncbi:hypothetical protein CLAVI_000178 [Candidatus Clavichlamydia salmonicola]|uniref:hypothetical protein n=1 Tax=Candidatus Clavichlamydia salmonicola TaxID=469812 RepID=UPI001891F12D|nr:hypothetical protein [Candidatus Clavichlamydia salmonicola]MBF5050567.1 hypothetical protein [Candidatus Clavichlamydia salmonicola]